MEFGSSFAACTLSDLGQLRDDAQALDESGFDYVTTAGHVLTARAERYEGRPLGTYAVAYRDPFVLYIYLAASTKALGFRTSILILPMFPTVLVAKQAADLALLSGNRLQLGVGISWQEPEYNAFGQDVHQRGRRLEEQLQVLRLLWSNDFVTFHGEFHDIDDLGIGQLPTKSIPVYVGSGATEALMRRIVRYADGWLPGGGVASPEPAALIRELAAQEGRDASEIALCGRIVAGEEGVDRWVQDANAQIANGATSITIGTPPDLAHDEALTRVIEAKQALTGALG